MLGFFLYFAAAVAATLDLAYLMVWSALGAPTHVLEFIACGGAALLLTAAYAGLWRPRIAAQLALGGALAAWAFYLPALRTTIARRAGIDFHTRATLYAVGALTCLFLATGYAAAAVFRSDTGANRLFPVRVRPRQRTAAIAVSVMLLGSAAAGILLEGRAHAPQRFTIVVPAGYVGWIRIDFGVDGAPPLTRGPDGLQVEIPDSGEVKTSTPWDSRATLNEYRSQESPKVPHGAAFLVQRKTPTGPPHETEYVFFGSETDRHDPQATRVGPDGLPVPGRFTATPSR